MYIYIWICCIYIYLYIYIYIYVTGLDENKLVSYIVRHFYLLFFRRAVISTPDRMSLVVLYKNCIS